MTLMARTAVGCVVTTAPRRRHVLARPAALCKNVFYLSQDQRSNRVAYDVAGQSVELPVQVRDASAGTAMFEVDAAAAAALLPTDAFEVVEVAPGRAHFAVIVVDYRDNDLGSYREVGLTLFVRPRAGGPDGTFILRLPVDQAFTCEAGRTIWGFPKTIEVIDLDYAPESVTCRLEMDGELVLRIRLPRGGADELPAIPMTAHTLRDGVPCATPFEQRGTGAQLVFDSSGVELELGAHPVAKELTPLGLPAPAFMSTWTEKMQATFEDARPL
jgi:hypothetical protein